LAAILAILKPRYVQYCFDVLALAWFFVVIGGLLLESVLLVQVNPYAYRLLPSVIFTLLPFGFLSVFVALYLGIIARVRFDQSIKSKNAIVFYILR
jgi:hypothetical protein